MRGLYIHIPFCSTKCDYCDFYSLKYNKTLVDNYTDCLIDRINNINECFDTVYFGGGTPSVIGGDRIARILNNVNHSKDAEITIECNPKTGLVDFFQKVAIAGVNRVSIGLQSANESELNFLTRKHNAQDVKKAVEAAKTAGINNISLDIILGIYNQTTDSLKNTLDFCLSLDIKHISAYMLQIEPNTPMINFDKSLLPNDDQTASLYYFLCEYLNTNNFEQYEISNFAKAGYESHHNLKYWNCEEYIGLGPAAHSFIDGKRYYFPRDINYFINKGELIFDSTGGDFNEYVMLRLRLKEGLVFGQVKDRGFELNSDFLSKYEYLKKQGLAVFDEKYVRLTVKGFLVQNLILSYLLN